MSGVKCAIVQQTDQRENVRQTGQYTIHLYLYMDFSKLCIFSKL